VTETRGKIFAIHADNSIAAYAADEVPEGRLGFTSETELAALSASWPARRLIEIWNRLPGVTAVSKFADRKTALRRIWQAVSVDAQGSNPPETAGKTKRPETKQAGTKRERIIALLKRPEGATLKAIMGATDWQAHSVRGFVSAQFKRDGERVYRIRS
jgi:hypothetical protein